MLNCCGCSENNTVNEKKALRIRFERFLNQAGKMNIDSTLDYTYPGVFTIIPRGKFRESKEESYKIINAQADLDYSLSIDTLYPIFHQDGADYAKAVYSVIMETPLDSTDHQPVKVYSDTNTIKHTIGETYAAPQKTLMATLLASQLGVEVASVDEINGRTRVHLKIWTLCIKDKYAKDWCFYTFLGNDTIATKLFSKKVLEKFISVK
jgi:hypothetical protein